ncbi:MAG TPA: S49 family peptidase [Accumulibacter sp.]|uniref:S49 family peptidase n=1 Tax=Accumulibacter sp. TaxID=2053492 RepID=UPI002BE6A492|nr:S49 family peptidase [Accumulibacter sp.]HRD86687.1 S49 family peptidase [Accumulibacter sp.]
MPLPHLASRLYGTPLLLARAKLDILLAVLGDRIGWPEPHTALAIPPPRTLPDAPPGLAVIPVYGTLVRRSLGLDAASGLTSYGEIGALFEAAVADPAVAGILLDLDSPGGEAGGVFELAQRVRAADAVKPVWAIAADSAFSAAYVLASAASRVYVPQTGGVGSIGVIALHVDQSARDAQQGYRYTAITAGEQKNDFSPHEPLDPAAHTRLQTEVDRLYGIFIDHVATMRKLEPRFVRSTQAGLYFGPEALTAGLADAQGSFDDAVTDFSAFLATRRSPGFLTTASRSLLAASTPSQEISLMTDRITPDVPPGVTPDPATSAEPATLPDTLPSAEDDPVQSAIDATRAEAVAIAELCQLAGYPQRTVAFLAQGASASDVRRALLAARAESPEIDSMIHPDAAAPATSLDSPAHNPLIQAVKKLTGKD